MDEAGAGACGRVDAEVVASGRKDHGRRALDRLIAATALAPDLPLQTRNPEDFRELESVLKVVAARGPQNPS